MTRWFFDPSSDQDANAIAGNIIGDQSIADSSNVSAELLKHIAEQHQRAREMLSCRDGLTIQRRPG
jgi:hypothetical protein